MKMTMYPVLGVLLVGLVHATEVWGRGDPAKMFRSLPAITNSMVNLGKMDISFHFNSKPSDYLPNERSVHYTHSAAPIFSSKSDHELEPCPCSSIKNFKNPFLPNPTDLLGKILKSNDLFSFNQEPVVSPMCCDSHEHNQDETVFFEIHGQNMPQFPMFDVLNPKSPIPSKSKAIEIFFFPKKKDSINSFIDFSKLSSSAKKKEPLKKSEIQIVGDKELKNDFKNYKYRPTRTFYAPEPKKEDLEVNSKMEDKQRPVYISETKKEDIGFYKMEDKNRPVYQSRKSDLEGNNKMPDYRHSYISHTTKAGLEEKYNMEEPSKENIKIENVITQTTTNSPPNQSNKL